MVEHVFRYTVGQSEFFQIHRIHPVNLFETDRIGMCLATVHTQKRTGFDVVEATVLHEKFDGCPGVRTLLDLVEENQCFSRNQRNA